MRTSILALSLLLAATASLAAPGTPPVGAHGFNWSKPKTAKCQALTEAHLKRFKSCSAPGPKESSGFGVHKPTHTCQAPEGEWMIYATQSQCRDEFETMEANAY